MLILGIESSCDDSGLALVENGKKIIYNRVANQLKAHSKNQGIVPEIAARKHLVNFSYLLEEVLNFSKIDISDITGIAVSNQPGLNGSLLMGVSLAKSLAIIYNKPLVGVNHLKSHFYSLEMDIEISYPYLGLLISGGHTILAQVHSALEISILGSTLDDAVGETLDKVAKHYNLGYPGGPVIEKLALSGDENYFKFPTPTIKSSSPKNQYAMSFSGLKTACIHYAQKYLNEGNSFNHNHIYHHLSASLQKTVFTYLTKIIKKAVKETQIKKIGVCGGVSANKYFRKILSKEKDLEAFFPAFALCTDNAAMVAGLGFEYFKKNQVSSSLVDSIRFLNCSPKNFKLAREL